MRAVGEKLGQAFQAMDDVIDATSTTDQVGKDVGVDRGKVTLVDFAGQNGALMMASGFVQDAVDLLASIPVDDDPLKVLVEQAFDHDAMRGLRRNRQSRAGRTARRDELG